MPRYSRPRFRTFMAARPDLANRLFNILGAKRIERIARQAAVRAARRAYVSVPFYRELYQRAGFDEGRMRRLAWADFLRLPTVGKSDIVGVPDQDLLDATIALPAGDAVIARSSGTTGKPTIIPTGWGEYYLVHAVLKQVLRSIGADRRKSVVMLAFGVDGNPIAGGLAIRCLFAIKLETQWPFEICAAGETPDSIISFLRYFGENRFETLYLLAPPGTLERVLDRLEDLKAQDPGAGVDWQKFSHKRIQLSGQGVARELQERIRRELAIADDDLNAMEITLGSSDTGQVLARSTPFTVWLERYIDQHPEIAERLEIPVEHRTKSIMEFVPPIAIYVESDAETGLLLTTWKHRPLIRFRSNDLAWLRSSREVVRTLNHIAKDWRKDFACYGYKRRDVPRSATLGMILGRADEACLVNAAHITPDVLRDALAQSGILPQIHHFKHGAGDSANEYDVYLELPDGRDQCARDQLAAEWEPGLLKALVNHPSAIELQAAHRDNPIDLKLFVRSRGEGEFEGDDQRAKKRYLVRSAKS